MIGVALGAVAVLIVTALGFAFAGDRVYAFDRAILLKMRDPAPGGVGPMVPEGPSWLVQAMIDITALGGATVLTLVVLGALGLLLIQRHIFTAALLAGGVVSGSLSVGLAKFAFGRDRPDVIEHLVEVGTASFPSGHSAVSAIVYLTVALMLTQIFETHRQRIYVVVLAAALVLTIGTSRVYLGVHWPSDVLAGWSFGALWALGWWVLGAGLRERYAGAGELRK
ncbi:phosphatase PAP2 family protein [Erythrobacter sp. SCSIO 43205]|nr:phosphatase PAP2 family protein [Erythrobacter sp. SCSIO 43205]